MFWRWAAVSLMSLAVSVTGLLSSREVHPLRAKTAANAANTVECSVRRGAVLFPMVFRGKILSIPPATAQSLKQRSRVGIAAGLSLHQIDPRLLIGLLRAEQYQVTRIAVLPLMLGEVECSFGGICRGRRRFETVGIC